MIKNITPLEKSIIELLEDLSLREQRILRMRFIQNMTQEQVGKRYHITKERIRQIEDIALKIVNQTLYKILKKRKKFFGPINNLISLKISYLKNLIILVLTKEKNKGLN